MSIERLVDAAELPIKFGVLVYVVGGACLMLVGIANLIATA